MLTYFFVRSAFATLKSYYSPHITYFNQLCYGQLVQIVKKSSEKSELFFYYMRKNGVIKVSQKC